MIHLDYRDRACDVCGGHDLETIWQYDHVARLRTGHCRWNVRNVLCCGCGFAFVSPAPTNESLARYYGASYETHARLAPPFSVDKRMALLRRVAPIPGTFLEVGSNTQSPFQSALRDAGWDYACFELNERCKSTIDRHDGCPGAGHHDVVATYFVLEHVPDPVAFLSHYARLLAPGGRCIVEVPDQALYPLRPAGLMLHEHLTHFTSGSITALAARAGLRLVEISHEHCSRPFGFVAVFAPAPPASTSTTCLNPAEVNAARSRMLVGLGRIKAYHDRLRAIRAATLEASREGVVILWGANATCADMYPDARFPERSVLVDSNPDKELYFPNKAARLPESAAEDIRTAALVVVCAPNYADEIIAAAGRLRGRPLKESEYLMAPDTE